MKESAVRRWTRIAAIASITFVVCGAVVSSINNHTALKAYKQRDQAKAQGEEMFTLGFGQPQNEVEAEVYQALFCIYHMGAIIAYDGYTESGTKKVLLYWWRQGDRIDYTRFVALRSQAEYDWEHVYAPIWGAYRRGETIGGISEFLRRHDQCVDDENMVLDEGFSLPLAYMREDE